MTSLLPRALGLLLESTALLGLGLAALYLSRQRGQAVQSLVARATLAGVGLSLLLAVPLSGHVRPLWRVMLPGAAIGTEKKPGEPTPSRSGSPPLPERQGKEFRTNLRAARGSEPLSLPVSGGVASLSETGWVPHAAVRPPIHRPSPLRLLPPALAATWGAGTALLLLWLGVCQWHLTRLRRAARPLTTGPAADALAALTANPPWLLVHPAVRSPFLAGILRPTVFLPDTAEADFPPDALRAILAHELAHLARRDCAWTLFCRVLCAVLWPQPLLWLLCRRLEQIGEEACDEAVLAQDCPPRAYADCLLTLAEHHALGHRERALGAGVAPFRSSLGRRVQRILSQGTHAMTTLTVRLRLTIAALTLAAVIGGAFLVSSAPAQVSASPVLAPTQTNRVPLVGTWLCTHNDGTGHVLIFKTDGHFEEIGPWPGESRVVGHSYGSNQAIGHSYGPYTSDGPELKYTDTRVWVEGEKPWKTDPYVHTMNYDLAGDVLTLRLKDKWVNVYHRIPAYTRNMLGIKPNTALDTMPAASDKQLGEARFLAGLTPVQGPGVVVTLDDSKKPYPAGLPPGVTPPNVIHDTDINQVVNELRAAGAEAIAVNGQRLVATSAVRDAGPTVFINNVPQTPPYTVQAIGDPQVLEAALNLRGGMASQLKIFDPAMFSIRYDVLLTLPAYAGANGPRYARPLDNKAASQNTVRFLAGLTPVQGPGVVVTLSDSKTPFPRTLRPGIQPPNIIHDTDINQIVNELRAAGAEAIAVNGQRLVATSAVRDAGPTVFINNTPQTPPYTIQAIGDSKTLASALTMRGGIADEIKSFDKGMFSLRQAGTLALPAYAGADVPHYAKPASFSGPAPADGAAGGTRARDQAVQNSGRRFGLGFAGVSYNPGIRMDGPNTAQTILITYRRGGF